MGAGQYWTGREPALEWFATIPFGMNPGGMAAWCYQGDGLKLMEEAYAAFNLVPRPSSGGGPADGRMVPEEDQLGRRLQGAEDAHARPLGSKVLAKAGGTVVLLPGERDLRRAREGRHRRCRVGRAARRHEAGPPQHRAVLLLPGLARAGHHARFWLQQEGVRGPAGRPAADARPCRGGGPGPRPHGVPREECDRARATQDGVQGKGRGASAPGAGAARSQEARGRGREGRIREDAPWPGRCTRRSRSSRRWSAPGTTSRKAPTISSYRGERLSIRRRCFWIAAGGRSLWSSRPRGRGAAGSSTVPGRRPECGVGGEPSDRRGAQGRTPGTRPRRRTAT